MSKEGRLAHKANSKKNRGENHGRSKLSETQVLEIKELLAKSNLSQHAIADRYEVSATLINHINTGRIWTHLTIQEII
jgi:DNA-binding transcriptional regulator YiaG